MVEIRTRRLLLRRARSQDLKPLHDIFCDRMAMRYWSTLPHAGLDETRDFLDTMMAVPADRGDDFIVEYRGMVIGKVGLHRFPEIGYIFHPAAWGLGYASEALAPVIDRAFRVFGLPAIEADVDPRNDASLRLLHRLGFEETHRAERTWEIGEDWCDSVYLALKRPAG